jgi:hypothetical protein
MRERKGKEKNDKSSCRKNTSYAYSAFFIGERKKKEKKRKGT